MRFKERPLIGLMLGLAMLGLWVEPSWAQSAHPFAVGAERGGGASSGLVGWILAQQAQFFQMLTASVRAIRTDPFAALGLMSLSFAYGVFHAAGPGHGKALIASYMLANEQALKRGIIISFLAGALQGLVAIAIVGVGALVFNATAKSMNLAAEGIEIASYVGIAVLGLMLLVRKGKAFLSVWRERRAVETASSGLVFAPSQSEGRGSFSAFAVDASHVHDANCGHFHAPDAATLGADFSWRAALMTVVTAGARPCSGAILVLVFSLAQGVFAAGIGATLAMSLGTAITTSALAALAVFAKRIAARFSGSELGRGALVLRGLEVAASFAILLLGVGLAYAALNGGTGPG